MAGTSLADHQSLRRSRAHSRATELTIEDIATELLGVLGKHLLAHIVNKDAKSLARWAAGEHRPKEREEKILRNTYQVFAMLDHVESNHTIRAWFMGMNPQLDDAAPAEALADERFRDVATAARAFVSGG